MSDYREHGLGDALRGPLQVYIPPLRRESPWGQALRVALYGVACGGAFGAALACAVAVSACVSR